MLAVIIEFEVWKHLLNRMGKVDGLSRRPDLKVE